MKSWINKEIIKNNLPDQRNTDLEDVHSTMFRAYLDGSRVNSL
ncbi:MAG: hypothetical protein WBN42_06140 [Ignavibacteriaceae bacterium]